MQWDDAKFFLALARSGQMKAAAARLGVDQATMGRRISALEQSLGTKLVHRQSRGTSLTDEGRALVPALERIESAFLEIQSQTEASDQSVSGTVRLGVPDGFGVGFLASRITNLTRHHPELRLELVPVTRAFSLSEREADIAVMVGRPQKGRLKARKLTDYTLSIYASSEYLDHHLPVNTLADLSSQTLVGYVETMMDTPALNYAAKVFGERRPQIEIASAMGQIEAVRAGVGIGVLHDYLVRNDEKLVRLLPDETTTRAYWIAWHESIGNLARIRAVIDFITNAVQAERNSFCC